MSTKRALSADNKRMLQLFWPIMIEQGLTIMVGVVSTILVSNVGDFAVAGVNLVDTINNMIIIFFNAMASGATVVVAQRIGARKNKEAGETAAQAIVLVVAMSIVGGMIAFLFANPILRGLYGRSAEDVLLSGSIYMRFSGISYLFLGLFSVCAGVTRASGDSKSPMIGAFISNIINLAIAAFLIFILDMGVYGVAIAMLVARIGAAMFMFYVVRNKKMGELVLPPMSLKLNKEIISPILNVGVPSGIDSLIFQGAKVLVSVFLSGMGTAALQANAIVGSLGGFINLGANAFSIVGVTLVGQAYGARMYKQAKVWMRKICLYSSAIQVAVGIPFLIFLDPMIASYGPSPEAAASARLILIISVIVHPFLFPTAFVLPNSLRATGDARNTMVISIISLFSLRILGSWVLGVKMGLGVLGIWLSMFADWGGRTIGFVYRLEKNLWNQGREPIDEGIERQTI
ncbi:MAG: MATE family efflux transporter [Firmicutes bacterium]|jgi:putative MATE family efflux protein|nr:MATE family efflux transporter [Bacillota bacterium]